MANQEIKGRIMFNLTHARHDPSHCLAPGLFRSLKNGDYKKEKLDVTYVYGKGEWMKFAGFEPLGGPEMRLLQGIVAMAGPSSLMLDLDEPGSEIGRQLSLFLDPLFDSVKDDARVVRSSLWTLMTEIGYKADDTKTRKSVMESLRRLSAITVIIRSGKRECGFHLLSYAVDDGDGKLLIALNPRITEAVLGRRPHTRIEMSEVRSLNTDPARIMHQRLCGYIDPGKSHPSEIDIDTLCGYVWVGDCSDAAMRQRRLTARKAIAEIQKIGWTVINAAKGKYKIGRPKVL